MEEAGRCWKIKEMALAEPIKALSDEEKARGVVEVEVSEPRRSMRSPSSALPSSVLLPATFSKRSKRMMSPKPMVSSRLSVLHLPPYQVSRFI